jgi:iron(III) transport system permease protein
VVPQIRRGLFVTWLTACIFAMRDTGISMIVYPPGQDTLPVRIFTLMANSTEQSVATLCVIMIAAPLLPAAILWAILKLHKGRLS